jgi:uncharacterized protein YfaS (alpha-2-macroglobulin family)
MSAPSSAHPPISSRRFWITVSLFILINAIAWIVYDRTFAIWHRGTLRVEAFEPGDDATVESRQTLRWHFSEDVLPTTAYGKDPGKVTPIVAGKWAWEDPRTLSFVPSVDFPRATPVKFTLANDLLRTGTGAKLTQPFVSSVHSQGLALQSIAQSAAIDNDQFVIELKFNDRVAPGDVLQHAHATLPDGRVVGLRLYGQSAGEIVRLATDSVSTGVEDTPLKVTLSPGLTGLSGPLGLTDDWQSTIPLGRKLMATQLTAYSPTRDRPYLTLSFNNEVEISALKKVLTIEPAVPFTLESDGDDAVNIRGDFQSGTRYTAHLAALPPGAPGEQKLRSPRAGQLAAFMPDRGSDAWFDNDQGYLSTAGNRTVVAHVINTRALRVSLTRMYDNNLVAWRNATDGDRWGNTDSFSKPIATKVIRITAAKNVRADIPICLDDLLPRDTQRAGVWRVSIGPANDDASEEDDDESSRSSAVVTLSDIGLTAKQTHDGLVAWATSLRSAAPLANVRVRAFSSKNQLLGESTTDADGLARLSNLHPDKEETLSVLLADVVPSETVGPATQPIKRDAELTWLDLHHTGWELGDSDISGAAYLRAGHQAFVYTDRGVYRPGETVHLRAIVRAPGTVAPKNAFPVKWQLRRPDAREWKNQTVLLDTDGTAALDIALPTDLPSGQWSATIGLPGDNQKTSFGEINFLVEDFIPNRLKTSLAFRTGDEKDPRRYSISDVPLDVEVQGDYLFGRPGAGLGLELINRATPVPFQPSGWGGWSFGDSAGIANIAKPAVAKKVRSKHHKSAPPEEPESASLDDHGRYRSSLNVTDILHLSDEKTDQYLGPWLLSTEAGVREAGGRAVTVSKQIAIDALPAYIAVRMSDGRTSARPGEMSSFQAKMVKPDGTPLTDTDAELQASLLRETWNTVLVFRDGRYHYDSTRVLNPVGSATIQLADGVGNWSVNVADSGEYVVRFCDSTTGAVTTKAFDCTDGSGWDENVDRENPERLQVRLLAPGENEDAGDSKTSATSPWHIGDTARVLIASPFKGRLLLSVETDDVVNTTVVDMTSTHMVVPVKVTDACWPNAFISATVIRAIDPNAKWQTHRAFGVTRLNVDSSSRQLQMTIDAPEVIRPLQSMDVGAKVTDSEGNAVANAAVTLAAVDEGICSLTDFKTPDPLKFFSSRRALGVQSADLFGLLMPEVAKPDGQREVGGDKPEADSGRYHSPVGARRVKPVALAWAEVHTDADGIARTSFSLPQFQGRLRVMAVGYTAKLLGSVDRGVTVRSPILAQSSWPRFAAPGDQFSVPVVLFNNTADGGDVAVSVEVLNGDTNLISLTEPGRAAPDGIKARADTARLSQLSLTPVAITAGGQQQVNFNVNVGQAVGVAKIVLHVAFGDQSYEEEMELPVRPASPMTQFGGIATVSTTQPIALGAMTRMMPGTDSLTVSVTPWPTLNLPQGLDYLDRYPYGCCEQTTSTCFPLVALGDIGKQLDPTHFDPDQIKLKIDSGITRLMGLQTADGGLSMWPGETDAWPWGSVYAAHFLTEAKASGYDVPPDFYDHLLSYVRHLMDVGTDDAERLETQSYAAYVMALAGKPERAIMDHLTELTSADARADDPLDGSCMRSDARLMLSCAWLLSGRRDLAEGLLPDAVPLPRSRRQWDGNLGSPVRDRAMLILAMEQVEPNRAELPELVQQLADQGTKSQWSSTQDVAFSVLAIGRYLRDQQKKTPYDSAKLLRGETVLAEASDAGSIAWTADRNQLQSSDPLHVQLTGPADAVGHLSWLQSGVPMSPPKDVEHGLKIHRRYLTLDGSEIHGAVHSGDLVRVELTVEAPPDQPNLVVEDLLPAGLEVENPRLETTAKDADESDASKEPTFGSGNLDVQDDRVVIVGRMPSVWKAKCSYLARAITAGTFTVPPVRCEAMYDLNQNAMSGSGSLTVLPVVKDFASAGD